MSLNEILKNGDKAPVWTSSCTYVCQHVRNGIGNYNYIHISFLGEIISHICWYL